MPAIDLQRILPVPYTNSAIRAAGDELTVIGSPVHGSNLIGMPLVDKGIGPGQPIPHLYGAIPGCRGNAPIGCPRDTINGIGVAGIGVDVVASAHLPYPYRFILARRSHIVAIMRPAH